MLFQKNRQQRSLLLQVYFNVTKGRITVTLKKVNSPKYWKSLQTDSAEVIGNLKIWYDMKNRFIDELREFEPEEPTEVNFKSYRMMIQKTKK